MLINPYLMFNGQCEAAFLFYAKCLRGNIDAMIRHRDTPIADQTPADWQDKIIHARMTVGQWVLMGSDAPAEHYQKPQGFSVTINVDETKEAQRLFKDLSLSGNVVMPLQETFWAASFGMLVDQFGIPWMINGGEVKSG